MAKTEAQKAANKRYNQKAYSNLSVLIKKKEYAVIDEFCKIMNISKARFFFWSCNYFIELGEIPPESEIFYDINDNDITL